jgi:hypothetical protein
MGDIIEHRRIETQRARADAVVGILLDWADSMKGHNLRLGYPATSAGFSQCCASSTFDEMCKQADSIRNAVVSACVDDLEPAQNAAIYHRYLAAVYRMRNYEDTLAEAHVALMDAFGKKGVLW